MDVLFLFRIKEHQEEMLRSEFPEIRFLFDRKTDDPAIGSSEVIVTYGTDIDESVLDRAKNLKWIMVASAGVEHMPLGRTAELDIRVTNVRGIHKTPMAETMLAHILAYRKKLQDVYAQQSRSEWNKKIRGTELLGSKALILGPGAIGGETGRLLQAFGVRTYGCNRSGRQAEYMDEMVSFDGLLEALPEMDTIISVLPSTQETKRLLGREHFAAMKDTALFLNFGRGDLYEEQVLIEALEKGRPSAAVLDVFETEPLPADSPFWKMKNVTVSPHISALSGKYVERSLEIFIPNLRAYLDGRTGEMINRVDPERGY
ncbi:D-2-hydroxyacid dehydrogenase [Bhargavaea beijingensis]|uniref:D-2-hydroxyacid dehydrogenase n=1 Tax=Bhargavaea beijingensis TaxID=426756 RepID=A0A1G7BDK3_9BACL|nr:D-2-hydroxyacid dehydrogenase [Bhargavaea beijingensis]MCW1928455.1 D-2-hydroxyacid dehydrogenase [Bhargavaea beijingensis]RSK32688.1 D-2-hydroxyacid dehydrogenase [Bhargavaea beijingensis]SDE25113.1 Phosphoglycerate dehydrogenase [Bhargavaea beijingensis]